MPTTRPVLEASLERALEHAAESVSARADDQLRSLVAFGSCYRVPAPARRCDLLVVLCEVSAALLRRISGPLRDLSRAQDVSFLIATEQEIAASADVFPVRFFLMQRRHFLLHGEDPVAELVIERRNLRLRVEQELRNLLLRTRRRLLFATDDAAEGQHVFEQMCVPLADCLECLSHLRGEAAPRDPRASEVLVERAHGDREGPWAELSAVAAGSAARRSTELVDRLVPALQRLVAEVDSIEVAS